VEPWYQLGKSVALPPARLWFDWHFEDLDCIPSDGPAIVACNHISYLDPFANALAVIKAGRRPRFLAKEELFRVPVVGRVLSGAGQIPVARGTNDPAPLRRLMKAITEGEVVLIYPEGTVTRRPDHLPMEAKTGTVRLSLATGVPITPLASWGSQAVWQKSGKGSLKYGRPVWVRAGPPIDLSARQGDAEDRAALKEMTASVMAVLTSLAEDLRSRYPARWSTEDG
jgi:1-acyl-sn-glycerol-3-phosphate acyltransferase